ncbi:MAG TPA: tRNA (guanosine(37)-N1)-methyltransferase TrmD [Firmicutes bacterium]|nr:tRNA (guanosine(37)-N1)-methyltransferase TrmD [Bacillota bacterium]
MRISILTLFPEVFPGPLGVSILGKAGERGLLQVDLVDIRDFAPGKHRITDDTPFGGGTGMVLKPEPVVAALERILGRKLSPLSAETVSRGRGPYRVDGEWAGVRVVLLTPQGVRFDQKLARELASSRHLVLICGHYEGVDERIRHFVTDEVSIGDYVLTGGEIPALVVADSVARLVPGVLGDPGAPASDSFAEGLLEGPQYTRPRLYRGLEVPPVLLSGDHQSIDRWRRKEALRRTLLRRPDLLARTRLDERDMALLAQIRQEESC